MRIVLTKRVPFSVPDGISHFLFSLANELAGLGHEVIGLTTREPSSKRVPELFRYPNLPVIRSLTETDGKGYGFEFWIWLKRGSQVLTELNPDLILVNGAVPCRYSCPSVTVAHDVDRRSLGNWNWPRRIYKAITYRLTDHLVTTCSELVNEVASDAFFPASKIRVIPTCITPELYHPRPISERRSAIVQIGMQEYKNPLASIRAFLPFSDRARLIVVGRIFPQIQSFVDSLSSSQRSAIELPGIVSDETLKAYLETA
ncbi:MAG: glycosyltransferase family 4 protein, partial [Verrucomicrobia bacterium]|nr:glycosyltransferase family 4 protein [Verrucomicrobiota bacterium]